MNVRSDKGFNNPLIYIFIIFILSSFIYELYSKNKLLAIFYVCSFFAFLLYFPKTKKEIDISTSFFEHNIKIILTY